MPQAHAALGETGKGLLLHNKAPPLSPPSTRAPEQIRARAGRRPGRGKTCWRSRSSWHRPGSAQATAATAAARPTRCWLRAAACFRGRTLPAWTWAGAGSTSTATARSRHCGGQGPMRTRLAPAPLRHASRTAAGRATARGKRTWRRSGGCRARQGSGRGDRKGAGRLGHVPLPWVAFQQASLP